MTYIAGNETAPFYSPVLDVNVVMNSFFISPPSPPADSCTYISGDWIIACSDNCIITDDTDLTGNSLVLDGTGTFTVEADIIASFVSIDIDCVLIDKSEDGKLLTVG